MPINNKGKYLETILDITHKKYLDNNICIVNKIPVNINLINTYNNKILNATFKENFNCDYIGLYMGNYFEIDAKETTKNYFNFNSIRKNQQKKLELVLKNKGFAYLIIFFANDDLFVLVSYKIILDYIKRNTQKIPITWFIENANILRINNHLMLDYIDFIKNDIICS